MLMTLDDRMSNFLAKFPMYRSTPVYSVYLVHSKYDLPSSGAVSCLDRVFSVYHSTILHAAVWVP